MRTEIVQEMKEKIIQLQNKILEKESYLKSLKILKLEPEQGFASKIVQSFPANYIINESSSIDIC